VLLGVILLGLIGFGLNALFFQLSRMALRRWPR
jgi:hypothetical protein